MPEMTPLETEIERFKHINSENHWDHCFRGDGSPSCLGSGYCGDGKLIRALLAERADLEPPALAAEVALVEARQQVKSLTGALEGAKETAKRRELALAWSGRQAVGDKYLADALECNLFLIAAWQEMYGKDKELPVGTTAQEVLDGAAGLKQALRNEATRADRAEAEREQAREENTKSRLRYTEVIESQVIHITAAVAETERVEAERDTLAAQIATMRAALTSYPDPDDEDIEATEECSHCGDPSRNDIDSASWPWTDSGDMLCRECREMRSLVGYYIEGARNDFRERVSAALALPATEAEKRVVQEDE